MLSWFCAPALMCAALTIVSCASSEQAPGPTSATDGEPPAERVEICEESGHSDHFALTHPIDLPADAPLPADVVPIVERFGAPLEEYESRTIVSDTIYLRSASAEFPNRDPNSGALILTRSITIQLFTNGWNYWWGESESTASYPCDAGSAPAELEVTNAPDDVTPVPIGPAYIPSLTVAEPNELGDLSELAVRGRSLHAVMTDIIGVLLPGCEWYESEFADRARWLVKREPTGLAPGIELPGDLIQYVQDRYRLDPLAADIVDANAERVLMIWLPRPGTEWVIQGGEFIRAQNPAEELPTIGWEAERAAWLYGCADPGYELADAWKSARADLARREPE